MYDKYEVFHLEVDDEKKPDQQFDEHSESIVNEKSQPIYESFDSEDEHVSIAPHMEFLSRNHPVYDRQRSEFREGDEDMKELQEQFTNLFPSPIEEQQC